MSAVVAKNDLVLKGSGWQAWLVYGLLFLFPIAGISVSHWFSGIYALLALTGLVALFNGTARQTLFKEERIWLWLCVAFFVSFLVSALVNGWDRPQNSALGVTVRYLFVVPLFLLLRQYSKAGLALLSGMLVAVFVATGHAYYDIYELGKARAEGLYSPNFLGPVVALMVMYLLAGWRELRRVRWLLPVAILLGVWALVMSGSRGGYVGLVAMVLLWALLTFRGRLRVLMLAVAVALPLAGYFMVDEVTQRVDVAVTEVTTYLVKGVPEGVHGAESSAIRFEMWRAAWMTFLDHPLLGVGDGNYNKGVQPYIDQGLVDVGVGGHGHPHNAYMNVLMCRGIVGYLVMMAMLFYPLYYFARSYRDSPSTAMLGMVHTIGFAIFSITDASTFDKNNFTSIYLLCMAVFLSWHAARVNQRRVYKDGVPGRFSATETAG